MCLLLKNLEAGESAVAEGTLGVCEKDRVTPRSLLVSMVKYPESSNKLNEALCFLSSLTKFS